MCITWGIPRRRNRRVERKKNMLVCLLAIDIPFYYFFLLGLLWFYFFFLYEYKRTHPPPISLLIFLSILSLSAVVVDVGATDLRPVLYGSNKKSKRGEAKSPFRAVASIGPPSPTLCLSVRLQRKPDRPISERGKREKKNARLYIYRADDL